jgi:hypothetical protein
MVWILSWVVKLLLCCAGSQICNGGGRGRLGSTLFWWVELFGVGYMICGTGEGYVIYRIGEGWGAWLWHSDRIDSRMGVVLGYCLGDLVEEIVTCKMGNIAGDMVPTALCCWLLEDVIL